MYHLMLYVFSIVTYVLLLRAFLLTVMKTFHSLYLYPLFFSLPFSPFLFRLFSFLLLSSLSALLRSALFYLSPSFFLYSCTPHILIHTCLFLIHTHSSVTSPSRVYVRCTRRRGEKTRDGRTGEEGRGGGEGGEA
jgi:hypothetical protein